MSYDGADPSQLRLSRDTTTTQAHLFVQEEKCTISASQVSRSELYRLTEICNVRFAMPMLILMTSETGTDNETLHTTERVSWLALEHGTATDHTAIRGLVQAPPQTVPNSHAQVCSRRATADDGHCIGCNAAKPSCSAGSRCLPKAKDAKGWKRLQ
jgi:hypothetical protein